MKPLNIAFVGSGNVASALAPALDALPGVRVGAICSPNILHSQELAARLDDAEALTDISQIGDFDLVIVSVKDDVLLGLGATVRGRTGLWVHTSGSVGMEALSSVSSHYGVFYPLQTFSKGRHVSLQGVPMLIEASDAESGELLMGLANRLTGNAIEADSQRRATLHLAAVFACNFANHAWALSEQLLAPEGLTLSTFKPLIEETLAKALEMGASRGQTGPAAREDHVLMQKQCERLENESEREVYEAMSRSIIRLKHK